METSALHDLRTRVVTANDWNHADYPVTDLVHAVHVARVYRHEMTDDQHREMAEVLRSAKGMVVLSGYPCPLYDQLYDGWQVDLIASHADGALDRTEALWMSVNCVIQPNIFQELSNP